MEQELDKQESIKPKRNEKGQLLPGFSGNLKGRPKGKTIKELVREWLEEHPDDMKAFVEHFVKKNKELAWQMMEGRPQQDITSAGEKIIPIPILDVKKIETKEIDINYLKLPQDGETIKETLTNVARINQGLKLDVSKNQSNNKDTGNVQEGENSSGGDISQ